MTMHAPVSFGAGGGEPYARALRTDGHLRLTDADRPDAVTTMDVGRWSAAADRVDRSLLDDVDGGVIDIGCGPGRMLVAARSRGIPALGVDVSAEAVAIAQRSGGTALQGSVFDAVPDEGHWDTALVIDGNIGIGGDPTALVRRASSVLSADGSVVVETAPDARADVVYDAQVVDEQGRASATFPWAEVGREALGRHAAAAGLRVAQTWSASGRTFCRLVTAR